MACGKKFIVTLKEGSPCKSRTVIVASGGRRRRLGIPGEDTFDGKGVAFCTTCDAPLFSGKDERRYYIPLLFQGEDT